VEEQFYLCWPLIVLIFSRRKLLFVTGFLIFAGFAYRLLGAEFGLTRPQILYSPLASLDSLCLGSFAAILAREPGNFSHSLNWLRKVGFYFALPALVATLVFLARGNNSPFEIYGQFFMAIFSAALLLNYRFSETAFGSRFLRTPALRYLGKISYGVYLYHFPFDRMLYAGWIKAGIAPDSVFVRFPFVLGCSVAVAAISWKFLEKPLTDLKRFFPYEPAMIPAPQQKSVAVPESAQEKGVGDI
jgi:peptidoglycan/LPS O-acetylase OafA/YrhL